MNKITEKEIVELYKKLNLDPNKPVDVNTPKEVKNFALQNKLATGFNNKMVVTMR